MVEKNALIEEIKKVKNEIKLKIVELKNIDKELSLVIATIITSNDKEIIAYCRGPFCVLADDAVKILSDHGFNVRRLDEGYPEWRMMQSEAKN